MRFAHGRGRLYPRAAAVATAILTTLALAAASTPAAASSTGQGAEAIDQRIAVPAYFYPGGDGAALWQRLNEAGPRVGIAVANPFSGPGKTRDPNYANAIAAARARGITVLGYVATGYLGTTGRATRLGETTPTAWFAQVQQEIETWYRLYGADGLGGIFFDEVHNECGPDGLYADAYRALDRHTRRWHRGAFTAVNPGIDTEPCYADIADVILTFEGTYESYLAWEPPAWHRAVDPRRLWHLVHATFTEEQLANAIDLSKTRNAGYLYLTPDVLANPWDTLPPERYWSKQLTLARAGGADDRPPRLFTRPVPLRLTSTEATLAWLPASDHGGGVAGYDVFVDGVRVMGTVGAFPVATVRGLAPDHAYEIAVAARDEAGNTSEPGRAVTITTEGTDGGPPAAPGDLRATETGVASVRLGWTPAAEDDVVAYDVFLDGTPLLSLPHWLSGDGGLPVSGLEPGTTYSFEVFARDASGNVSPAAGPLTVTTQAPPAQPITEASGSVGATDVTYQARFNLPFDFHHVFVDTDNDATTGFATAGVGADLLIENGWLYRHTGTGWSWAPVDGPSPLVSSEDGLFVWRVPVAVFGGSAGTHRAVFHGAGSSPEAFSSVITIREA